MCFVANFLVCPKDQVVHRCNPLLCYQHTCLAHPAAVCRINPCGNCTIEFYNKHNRMVDCMKGELSRRICLVTHTTKYNVNSRLDTMRQNCKESDCFYDSRHTGRELECFNREQRPRHAQTMLSRHSLFMFPQHFYRNISMCSAQIFCKGESGGSLSKAFGLW